MPLEKLNFFDDLNRIRTPVEKYDGRRNYTKPLQELIEACKKHNFYAVSPENLSISGMPPIIAIGDGKGGFTAILNPKIESSGGNAQNLEACGNIFLIRDGKEIHPVVHTIRPEWITLSFVLSDGTLKKKSFREKPFGKGQPSLPAIITHEMDHSEGKTITDIARARLEKTLKVVSRAKDVLEEKGNKSTPELVETLKKYLRSAMPLVIMRDGGIYRVLHGSEFEGGSLPNISEDAIFLDGFFESPAEIVHIRIPRENELVPLIPSKTVLRAKR